MAKYTTYQQHEPLRVPDGWNANERKLIAQLEEMLDDIYARFNRLKLTDLAKPLQTTILNSENGVTRLALEADRLTADVGAKVTTFSQDTVPTSTAIGDIWINTDDNNKIYRAASVGANAIEAEGWVPQDVASGYLKTSHVEIASDHINVESGGAFSVVAPTTLSITAGAGTSSVGIRNDTYFLYAGNAAPADAPFNVTLAGGIKAISGTVGGFTLYSNKLEAAPAGKPVLTLDAANSVITLGPTKLAYDNDGLDIDLNRPGSAYSKSGQRFHVYETVNGVVDEYFSVYNLQAHFFKPFWVDGYAYIEGNCSAESFTDRTPDFTGNALEALAPVKSNTSGNIDHSSLPKEARKPIKKRVLKNGKVKEVEEEGRDLGMMISILTKAVQELTGKMAEQQAQIDKLLGKEAKKNADESGRRVKESVHDPDYNK